MEKEMLRNRLQISTQKEFSIWFPKRGIIIGGTLQEFSFEVAQSVCGSVFRGSQNFPIG